jgi:hypothetical protein
MARTSTRISGWEAENRAGYPPSLPVPRENTLTFSLDQNKVKLLGAGGKFYTECFGTRTMSAGREVEQLKEYFLANVVASFELLADPYAITFGTDPFDYRSVPFTRERTLSATIVQTGRIPPSQIDDN